MTEPWTVSCALVTRNRPGSLARTLTSLSKQRPVPLEVIVSDDSDAEFAGDNRGLVESFGYRYLTGPRNGLYGNRNFVARHCAGTHIRSVDDDHEFPEGHFRACYDAVSRDPRCVWFIGECYPASGGGLTAPICPGQLNVFGVSETPPDPQDCWSIADGASIYPRVVFDQGHAFEESFKFGAAYLEFGSYLYRNGFRMRHLEETYVIHHFDPTQRSFLDPELELSSRLFAMLCHSFLYQRHIANQIATTLKCIQYGMQLRRPFASAGKVLRAFNRRRWELAERQAPAALLRHPP
jgi:glycosyltransferase involved in cell wall biosynthesis